MFQFWIMARLCLDRRGKKEDLPSATIAQKNTAVLMWHNMYFYTHRQWYYLNYVLSKEIKLNGVGIFLLNRKILRTYLSDSKQAPLKLPFVTISACFYIQILFSNLNSNFSNLLDMRKLQEQIYFTVSKQSLQSFLRSNEVLSSLNYLINDLVYQEQIFILPYIFR